MGLNYVVILYHVISQSIYYRYFCQVAVIVENNSWF